MACISYVDAQLGKVLDELDRLKLTQNTIIVLWGDHGYHLGDHSIWNKHSNLEQATRIPFMFAGPNIPKNKKIETPVELVDLFPTLFELTNTAISSQMDGKSLTPLFKSEKNDAFALSQFTRGKQIMGYSIRTNRYRYTVWFNKEFNASKPYDEKLIVASELYDLENDYNETINIINLPENKTLVEELHSILKEKLSEVYTKSNK